MGDNENLENMVQELRRGLLMLAVLGQLGKQQYGYALLKLLSERGMQIDQGTLSPLLRRLEAQGLLQSNWDVEAGRPRRYYIISTAGRRLFARLRIEYDGMVAAMGGRAWLHSPSTFLPIQTDWQISLARRPPLLRKVLSSWSRTSPTLTSSTGHPWSRTGSSSRSGYGASQSAFSPGWTAKHMRCSP